MVGNTFVRLCRPRHGARSRVGLGYGEEVHQLRNFRGMEQYDWLWSRFLIG